MGWLVREQNGARVLQDKCIIAYVNTNGGDAHGQKAPAWVYALHSALRSRQSIADLHLDIVSDLQERSSQAQHAWRSGTCTWQLNHLTTSFAINCWWLCVDVGGMYRVYMAGM